VQHVRLAASRAVDLYHALITRFKELTGCRVLVNTSFNVRGEPIVCTPDDAFRCFMGNEIDLLVMGNCVLKKLDQRAELKNSHAASIDPD
jgi:carbamoyltransferase